MSSTSRAIDESRGLRRLRIKRTVYSGFVAKAAMFLPTLVITKVAVPVLGPERFGVLMTILSLVAFLSMADLGVGSSLVTSISRATGSEDYVHIRQLQANGFVVVSCLAALLLAAAIGLRYTDIGALMFPKSAPNIRREATAGLSSFAICFAVSLPLTLIGKIQLGLQRGHIANYWQVAMAVTNFSAAALAIKCGLDIPWIIAGMLSGTVLCATINMVIHYYSEPLLRPSRRDISTTQIRMLLSDSVFYLALQLIFMFAYSADTLIVARVMGAQGASVYALSERLFSIVAVAVAVITGPLWAAYGEALGAKDSRWVGRTLRLGTARIVLAALIISASIIVLLHPLVRVLSSGRLDVPLSLAVSMACWRLIEAAGTSLSVYMLASRAVQIVLIAGAATAGISFVAKVTILPHTGMYAVPVIMGTCYVLFCLLPTIYYLHRIQSSADTFPEVQPVS